MPIPKVNVQFIDTIQPDIPDWINVDLAQQFDLVTYENDLSKKMLRSNISFSTKQLLKRVYKEVFRISGEVVRENFKETLTQNWFGASHEELIKLLKRYKTIPDNTVTQASLLQYIQNMSKKMLRSNISPLRGEQ